MKLLSGMSRVALVSLVMTAVAVAPGCKKDEPATPEAAGAEGAAKEAGKAAAETAKKAAGLATGEPAAAAPRGMDLPAGVLSVAGIPSLRAALAEVTKLGNKLAPGQLPQDISSLALEGLKGIFGFTDITWLKQDAPIRFFNVDPKSHEGKGNGIVLPITDKDKVLAALKADAKKDVEGHAASFEHQFQTWYVDFADGVAVLTDHPGTFGEQKDFVGGKLAAWQPERLFTVRVNMDAINRIFAKEMADVRQTAKAMAGQAAQDPYMPDASKIMEEYVNMAFGLVESIKAVDVALYSEDADIKLGFGLAAKPDSTLSKFVGTIAGKSSSLADVAPPTTWLGMSTNMDVREIKSMRDLQKMGVDSYAKLLKLTPEEQARILAILDKVADVATGEGTTAIAVDGNFPFAITALMKVTDANAVRAAYAQMLDIVFAKAWAMALEEMKKEGQEIPGAADVKSLDDLIKLVGGMAAGMGVKVETISEKRGDVQVDALTVKADLEKLNLKEADPEAFAIIDGMIGDTLQIAFTYKGTDVGVGFGPNGVAQAVDLANGKRPGGEKALTAASRGNAMAMTVRVDTLMNALMSIPDLAGMKGAVEQLPKGQAFTLTGSGAGDTVTFTLALPIDTLAALAKMGGGM